MDIYILRTTSNGTTQILQPDGMIKRVAEGMPKSDDIKPVVQIAGFAKAEILKALLDALQQHGIKGESESKLEGKLEAVNSHLKDLRHLLKLPLA